MTIEKILCLGVGFIVGVAFTVIAMVCMADKIDEHEQRKH